MTSQRAKQGDALGLFRLRAAFVRFSRAAISLILVGVFHASTVYASEWLAPIPLNTNADIDDGDDAGVVIRLSATGTMIAIWQSNSTLNGTTGTDNDILFSRSTDGGETWSVPEPLNTTADLDGTAGDAEGDLATDGNGNWMAVWRSSNPLGNTIGDDNDIVFAASEDDGLTWTGLAVVNNDAEFDQFFPHGGADDSPRLATDGAGSWMIVWYRYPLPFTDLDVVYSVTTDLGETWTDPAYASNFGATDERQDDWPTIVSTGVGAWMIVWMSQNPFGGGYGFDRDIFVSRTADNGVSWSDPQPVNSNAATDGNVGTETSVQIAGDGEGHWMIVWAAGNYPDLGFGNDHDVFFSVSADDGVTWSDLGVVNTNAASDNDDDSNQDLVGGAATNFNGTWMVVWSSTVEFANECGAGGIGVDGDILFAMSTAEGDSWTEPQPVNSFASLDSQLDTDVAPTVLAIDGFHWLAVWKSRYTLGDTIGDDDDLLMSRTTIPDADNDGVPDVFDNCLGIANSDQLDADDDGVGDACDECPFTLPGSSVDADGVPLGDLDGDCDVDLGDFGILQANFTGAWE